jgi:hypothetical protein
MGRGRRGQWRQGWRRVKEASRRPPSPAVCSAEDRCRGDFFPNSKAWTTSELYKYRNVQVYQE